MQEDKKKKKKIIIYIIAFLILLLFIYLAIYIFLWGIDGKFHEKEGQYDSIETGGNVIQDGDDDSQEEIEDQLNEIIQGNNSNGTNENTNYTNTINGEDNNITDDEGGQKPERPEEPEIPDEPEIPEFKIESEDFKWGASTKLKVFKNIAFNHGDDVIWPGATGKYSFTVSNTLEDITKYTIDFEEENQGNINLKYKLIKNGNKIINNWTSIKDISLGDNILNSNEKDIYTLEWKWIEQTDEEDMSKMGQSYRVDIKIYMEKQ